MSSIEWLAKQPATTTRVHRYLRDGGRPDAALYLATNLKDSFCCQRNETTADAAVRVTRLVGPPPGMREKLAAEIKMMLHASRDAMRTRWNGGVYGEEGGYDPKKIRFGCGDGYFGEAFGIVRAMQVIGWGEYGAITVGGSLSEWFWSLQQQVLDEENFGGSGECDWCLKRYGRDDAGRAKEDV